MKQGTRVVWLLAFAMCVAMVSSPAFAQGGAVTTTLSGVVADASQAVIPGADVSVKDNARGIVYTAVTGANGAFTVPSLNPGTYTVTVALQGFKTAVIANVVLNAGVPAAVKVVLEVGALEETVIVQATTELVQTQATAVAQTLSVKQITGLPLTSRSVMDFLANLPGVNAASDVRSANISGLPQSAINITLDGMNIQDNMNKTSDGFFALVSPRIDAIEEVTMSSAAGGADVGAQGATQIRFTTRSGSNDWRGSAYYYYRNEALNANTWFNKRDGLAKAKLLQKQPGARLGGPIARDKAFFFFNYEESRSPSDRRLTRTVLSPQAQAGNFLYNATDANGNTVVKSVSLLNIAGNQSTIDPVVAKLLADIRASTQTTGSIVDQVNPLYQTYTWQNRIQSTNRFPTARIDYNLTSRHRFTGTLNYQNYYTDRDSTNNFDGQFPGFPIYSGQQSKRYAYSTTVRSMLGSTLVNEARYGGAGSPISFWPTLTPDLWSGSLANQAGFQLGISAAGITNASYSSGNKQARNAFDHVFEDNLSWLRGSHSFNFGFGFTRFTAWMTDTTQVPSISFGIVTGDPANTFLTQANFPGANMTDVKALYSVLMGHVSQIAGVARLDASGNYVYMSERLQQERMDTFSGFATDTWRIKPNLTLNGGVRYDLQMPFKPLNDNFSTATMADVFGVTGVGSDFVPGSLVNHLGNLFQPGVLQGQAPTFQPYTSGTKAYNIDWNNLAPSVGVAWTVGKDTGFLRRLLGRPGDAVIRGGYSVGFSRSGLGDFQGVFGANPGGSLTVTRSLGNNNLGTLPVLLSQPGTLGPADFPATRAYPLTDVKTQDVSIFDPNIQVPYAQTYTVGIQRALSKTYAVEARYVGTRSRDGWTTYNYNEINIDNAWGGLNSFLNEFKLAQANLQYNVANGKGNTFAYTGAGTNPLPIYLAYFTGQAPSKATDPNAYKASSNFSNSSYYNYLAARNPNPFSAAGTGSSGLNGSQTNIDNAVKAGLPANLFMVNPDLRGGVNVTSNGGFSKYDSAQLELRHRQSGGLTFTANYTFGRQYGSNRYSFKVDRVPTLSTGGGGGVDHALRANWVYELPFGQGKRFGGGVTRKMNMLIGGWQVNGIARIQSGRLVDLGNVRLVNMTANDIGNMFQLRIDPTNKNKVWMLPQDIIDNTVKAFSVLATSTTGYGALGPPTGRYFAPANGPDCIESIPSGYGQCGTRSLVVTGPLFAQVDLSLVKRINVTSRITFDFMGQILNALNRVNFTPVGGIGSSPDSFEVLGAQIARQAQLSWRVSW
jgi:hypothetical protein